MFITTYIARRKETKRMIQLENAEIARIDFAIAMKPYMHDMITELMKLENRVKELESA